MSMEGHITELRRKHADLVRQVKETEKSPGADRLEVYDLKRRRLALEDEIAQACAAA
jgi:hypothetical protein